MAESAKFPKAEKLCGRLDIAALMAHGRRGACGCIRYCCLVSPLEPSSDGGAAPLDCARVMVSVPKKHFKRAVRRNLLKRRIREAYRLQKALLLGSGSALSVMDGSGRPSRRYDILFTYVGSDIASYEDIAAAVASILKEIRRWER
jgi:ribonuclease P protein component